MYDWVIPQLGTPHIHFIKPVQKKFNIESTSRRVSIEKDW
jgi:hypothetical protein